MHEEGREDGIEVEFFGVDGEGELRERAAGDDGQDAGDKGRDTRSEGAKKIRQRDELEVLDREGWSGVALPGLNDPKERRIMSLSRRGTRQSRSEKLRRSRTSD